MNKYYTLLLILFFTSSLTSWSKTNQLKYPISRLSEEIKMDAHAIIRFDKTLFNVESIHKATYKKHIAITILNKNGNHYSNKAVYYNKHRRIKNFKAFIYDKNGKLIKKLKKSDLHDCSAVNSGTHFDDNRMIYCENLHGTYPFTIEYQYEIEYTGIVNYPIHMATDIYNCSVVHSQLKVLIPKNMQLRSKSYCFKKNNMKKESQDLKTYSWQLNNMKAIQCEPFSPSFSEIVPRVILAPVQFEYEGFRGTQDTWSNFGQWIHQLNKDRLFLPKQTTIKAKDLVRDCKTDFEKVKVLYQYMQSKTRYVSIQLGIGSWQPFTAQMVDKLGYGDCKALSIYMKSLLNAIGIRSHYTLVKAGKENLFFDKNFVRNQFNHAILMVPLAKDSIWLECTSQKQACGFLGSYTDDRDVLIIKEKDSELKHSPKYSSHNNTLRRRANVTIDENGNALARTITEYTGLQSEKQINIYDNKTLSNFRIDKFEITRDKMPIPTLEQKLDFEIQNYLSQTGDHFILPLNLMNKNLCVPKKLNQRQHPIIIKNPHCDTDSIQYVLPKNMRVEHLPSGISLKTKFGEIDTQIIQKDHTIRYIRHLKIFSGKFLPEEYEELRDFYKTIIRTDNIKVILRQQAKIA